LALYRCDYVQPGSVTIEDTTPRITGNKLNRVRTALTKESKELIKQFWSGDECRDSVKAVPMKGKFPGTPPCIGARLKHINLMTKRAESQCAREASHSTSDNDRSHDSNFSNNGLTPTF
jgi:hypothetical protein